MTRKEIKEWGQHMADKVFHLSHKEIKSHGTVNFDLDKCIIYLNAEEFIRAGFYDGEHVDVIVKKASIKND